MPKRILIVDDDPDFTGLLTDIYRQSSYETVPFNDPKAALAALREGHFDMLVTDHRMPEMTGEVLVRELRKTHPDLPVIVVSGFLDNDTIRDFIRGGIGGMFLKPLNVANLLKRTANLLNEADAILARPGDGKEATHTSKLPFRFESSPCISKRSFDFAGQLYAKRAFKHTLTLVTPPGSPTPGIIEDLMGFDTGEPHAFAIVPPNKISYEDLGEELIAAQQAGIIPTLVFRNLDLAGDSPREVVNDLGARRGVFAELPPARLLFTFTHPVDELYEKGRIDEQLYVLASIAEIVVPALAECREDIPVIAERILREHCEHEGISPPLRLHKLAQSWLREQPWPGNYEELAVHVTRAAKNARAGYVTRESFTQETNENQWIGSENGVTNLESYLRRLRDDYVQAALILAGGDPELAAESLAIPVESLIGHPMATTQRESLR